jgi:hypothetical protein
MSSKGWIAAVVSILCAVVAVILYAQGDREMAALWAVASGVWFRSAA